MMFQIYKRSDSEHKQVVFTAVCRQFSDGLYAHTLIKKFRGLSPQANYTDQAKPFVFEVSANVCDRGCHIVSVTDSYGRILGFPDRSRYFFFQEAPQLYSRG
jgi:hypothetical protein